MNRKKIKKIRRRAKELLVEWLQSLVSDEEKKKMTDAQKEKVSAAFGRIRSGAKGAGIIHLDAEFYLDDVAGGDSGGGCGGEEE